MRKRYLRRSTGIAGHGRPLTRMTSPNIPDPPPVPPLSSKMSSPELVNIASLTTSGTSYAPCGIGSESSCGSCRMYIAARPMYAFGAVMWTPWSWYQSVRAFWKLG